MYIASVTWYMCTGGGTLDSKFCSAAATEQLLVLFRIGHWIKVCITVSLVYSLICS